jgi:RNA polymerase sigma-70 factor, ECF subfamily
VRESGGVARRLEARSLDGNYVRALAAGDGDVQADFADRMGRFLRCKVRANQPRWSAQEVEEAVQETFVRVLDALRNGRLREPDRFAGYISRVCEIVMLEHGRGSRRLTALGPSVEQLPAEANPEEETVRREEVEIARHELARMPERDRNILRRLLIGGSDKDEVCREFGVDRNHLRVIIHRAKGRFRSLLEARRGGRAAD